MPRKKPVKKKEDTEDTTHYEDSKQIEEEKQEEEEKKEEDNEEEEKKEQDYEEEEENEEEYEEVEDVNENFNANEGYNKYENDENEISDDMFNLKEEETKSTEKIKITYENGQNEGEATSLDKNLKLYNNNYNIIKPKYLGKTKTLLFFRNTPILVLTESSN